MAGQYHIGMDSEMSSLRGKLMIVYFCSMLALSVLNICVNTIPNTLSANDSDMIFSLISQIVCMGAIPVVGTVLSKPRGKDSPLEYGVRLARNWRLHAPTTPKVWLVIIPLVFSFYFTTQLLARIGSLVLLLGQFTFPIGAGQIYGDFGDLLKWIALGALLPGIFEELTHRGLLLDALADRGNEIESVVWCGLLFGAMHTNVMQFFFATVGGMIFAFVVLKTNSIYPAMLLHFCNNTFSHVQNYAEQHPTGAFRWIAEAEEFLTGSTVGLLVGAALLVGCFVLTAWLLAVLQKVCGKPEGLRERWIFRSAKSDQFALSLDAYRPYGKATLKDNLFMYGAFAMCLAMTAASYVWGVLR